MVGNKHRHIFPVPVTSSGDREIVSSLSNHAGFIQDPLRYENLWLLVLSINAIACAQNPHTSSHTFGLHREDGQIIFQCNIIAMEIIIIVCRSEN